MWLSALLELLRLAYEILLFLTKQTSHENRKQLRAQIVTLKGAKDEETRIRAARNLSSLIRKL